MSATRQEVRAVAFYLPQFHPIPENDAAWGPGFTEWHNVARARPLFRSHQQPRLPGELGFYDLRLDETREAQAELARTHGIDAFCYYHYWFAGHRPLRRPLDAVLASGRPTLPFLLCWANENWTRRWSGGRGELILAQAYDEHDDRRHGEWLATVFADERYVRVDGRAVFLVYRASELPDPRRTTDVWRRCASEAGVGELLLLRVESFKSERADPRPLGFDGAVEFQPDWKVVRPALWRHAVARGAHSLRLASQPYPRFTRMDYETVIRRALTKPEVPYRRFSCVTPRWDNTARRDRGAVVLDGATPAAYQRWLEATLGRTPEPLVFVNAWNEWAEGAHLEPDMATGRSFLEAHLTAMRAASGAPSV